MKITTDHHRRPLLTWDDLTPAEQRDFSGQETRYGDRFKHIYIRAYRQVWTLDAFTRLDDPTGPLAAAGWTATCGLSAWSALVIKLVYDDEAAEFNHRVIVGYVIA